MLKVVENGALRAAPMTGSKSPLPFKLFDSRLPLVVLAPSSVVFDAIAHRAEKAGETAALYAGGLLDRPAIRQMTTSAETDVVLIVDDDEVARTVLAELVAMDGFVAATAPDGVEALEFLRGYAPSRAHDAGSPKLVAMRDSTARKLVS
jgi:hypothetical protein